MGNSWHMEANIVPATCFKVISNLTMISITDLSGCIVFVNDQLCKISGYSKEELVGRRHRILKSGSYPDEFFEEMWTTVLRGDTWHREICNRHKHGKLYWVDATVVPIKDHGGQISHFLSFRVDITARKQTEMRLREQLKESACLHEIRRNLARDELAMDALFQLIFGNLIAAMQYPDYAAAMIELDSQRFTSEYFDTACTHRLCTNILVNDKISGQLQVCYPEDRAFTLPREQNLINTLAEDLGKWLERKQTERMHRENEDKFRSIFEGSNDAIMLLTEQAFFDCNMRALEIFGLASKQDFLALHPAQLSPLFSQMGRIRSLLPTKKSWQLLNKGMNGSIGYTAAKMAKISQQKYCYRPLIYMEKESCRRLCAMSANTKEPNRHYWRMRKNSGI